MTTNEMKERLIKMIEEGSEEELKELAETLMELLKEEKKQ